MSLRGLKDVQISGDIEQVVEYSGLKLKREVWVEDNIQESSSYIDPDIIGVGELNEDFWGNTKI